MSGGGGATSGGGSRREEGGDRRQNLHSPDLELLDPTPDILTLFGQFNREFFGGGLGAVTVEWSKKLTSTAGLCYYHGRMGGCRIKLSEPLLALRPRTDLVDTLLHEMIHAHLFIQNGFSRLDRDGHGPDFKAIMHRINAAAGSRISVYHTFYDEVKHYQKHWWKCDGPCAQRSPFFGLVKRAMNRAPGPNDLWWAQHAASCTGTFIKVREPDPKPSQATGEKKIKKGTKRGLSPTSADSSLSHPKTNSRAITNFFNPVHTTGSTAGASSSSFFKKPPSATVTKESAEGGGGEVILLDDDEDEGEQEEDAQLKMAIAMSLAEAAAAAPPPLPPPPPSTNTSSSTSTSTARTSLFGAPNTLSAKGGGRNNDHLFPGTGHRLGG